MMKTNKIQKIQYESRDELRHEEQVVEEKEQLTPSEVSPEEQARLEQVEAHNHSVDNYLAEQEALRIREMEEQEQYEEILRQEEYEERQREEARRLEEEEEERRREERYREEELIAILYDGRRY